MAEQRRHKITEAAEILGVNPWTLRRKVYKNQIPYIKEETGRVYIPAWWVSQQAGDQPKSSDIRCAIYARESSSENKAAMSSQIDGLTRYATAKGLKATNFNSQFRLLVMRDDPQLLQAVGETSFWQLTDSVKPIAAANPQALTAAKADLAHGGNCGEHAEVAFDYLRVQAVGETLYRSAKQGLDHEFVLMGVPTDSDADIVVADPWPTKATATTWEDHFAYTSDHKKIQVYKSMVADGQNVKAVIAAGLTLTDKGKQVAALKRSDKQTEELLKRSKELHFWTHPDAAASGHNYDYHT